ncbi:phage tail tape measure protein [Mesonia sp. HuA40]|uniref:phage tail tape measure protein n=1 Tax=Mesonia sp. HuA40 TaxID=2602761 RepID=UPI0011CA57AD|nr:phage tail tape measure protein [Mesonia sp. HuA40]TXK73963.1 hypothetical protein FT993_03635 [Mesonia sp. HuA40]
MAVNNSQFNLTIRVNGKEVKNTLNGVGKELRSLRARTKNLTEGTEEWYKANKELAKTEKIYDDLKKNQRELLNETKKSIAAQEDQNAAFADFSDNVGQAFAALRTGDLVGFRAAMLGVAGGLKAATKAGLAFIATPIGATIAALGTIAFATKKWFDYNKAVSQTIKLTEQLTDFSGERLSQYRASVQATADTFDKDFNDVLRAANNLSKQMGITQEESLELINQGFVRGADAQNDFLDKVKEYPVQFKNAGYSAQDFIDIATQEATGGIYGDKLLDAIKEADLSLKEFTNTQREALENAFGKKFADEMAKGLSEGSITTRDALNLIMQKSDEMGLNLQQKQQLVADVFKGAGEDAGGFEEILNQINEAFSEQNKELSETERSTQRLVTANKEYEQALASLFDASQSGFPAMLNNLKSIGTEISTNILTGIKRMFTGIEQLKQQAGLKGQSDAVKQIVENTKEFGTTFAEEAQIQMDATAKNIERLSKKVQEQKDSWFGSSKKYEEELAEQKAYFEELKLIAQGESQELQVYLDEIKFGESNTGTYTPTQDKNKEKADKKAEKEEQDKLDRIRRFEKLKKALLNEIELQNEEEEQAKEELKEEQRYEKEQAALEDLKLTKEEQDALLELMEESHQNRMLAIQEKFQEKRTAENQKFYDDLIAAQENLEAAKSNAMAIGISNLKNFFGDFEGIYKALFLLEKGLAIGEIITNSSKAIAVAKANLATIPAFLPPGIPNPAFALAAATTSSQILATKITAATQIASIAGQTLTGFADGGFTDMFGQGYKDATGHEVAGVVHTGEYVVPKVVRQDPEVPQILNYLETKRKKKLGLYATGGETNQSTSSSNQDYIDNNNMLMQMMQAFMNKLDQPLEAPIYFGPEAELKRQEQQKKLEQIINNSKIKK